MSNIIITLPPRLVADGSDDSIASCDVLIKFGLEVIGSWDGWASPIAFSQEWSGFTCAAVFSGSSLPPQLLYQYKFRSIDRLFYNPDANCCDGGSGSTNNWDVLPDAPARVVLPLPLHAQAARTVAIAGSFNAWLPRDVTAPPVQLQLSQGNRVGCCCDVSLFAWRVI
jgi:hypothetical protein